MSVTIKDAGIEVQITAETASVEQATFDSLAFVQPMALIADRIKHYTSLEAVALDYNSNDQPYRAASTFYSQNPTPTNYYVIQSQQGAAPLQAVGTNTIAGTVGATGNYVFTIDTTEYTVPNLSAGAGAVSAVGSYDLSGAANATGDGDTILDIDGTDYIVTSNAGDTGTAIADLMVVQINAGITHTAVNLNGVITITAVTGGVAGNAVVFTDESTDTTMTGVALNPTGGQDAIPADDQDFIASELANAINAGITHTASAVAGVVTITARAGGIAGNNFVFGTTSEPAGVTSTIVQPSGGADATIGESITDTLNAALAINSDFYAVALNSAYRDDVTQIEAGAQWAEGNERMLWNTTNDPATTDGTVTTDIASHLKGLALSRTVTVYSADSSYFPEIAAFSILATTDFRGTNTLKTLKFKEAAGIPFENITGAQLAVLQDKNANVIHHTNGRNVFNDGATANSGWSDQVHGTDALAEEIRIRVYSQFVRTSSKIPYTEAGMASIKSEVEGALLQYVQNGFLAGAIDEDGNALPAYTISSLPVSQVSTNQKAQRVAPTIEFTARLAGAVHEVLITGTLVL